MQKKIARKQWKDTFFQKIPFNTIWQGDQRPHKHCHWIGILQFSSDFIYNT